MKKTLRDHLESQEGKGNQPVVDDSYERIAASLVRQKQSSVIDWVKEAKQPVILTNKGADEAAIVSLSDVRLIDLIRELGITNVDVADPEAFFRKVAAAAKKRAGD